MGVIDKGISGSGEVHATARLGWLRASVLGANNGILSTSSLIIGVASAHTSQAGILLSGISSLIAGAMSMAAGEYVSVSSQADSEKADLTREKGNSVVAGILKSANWLAYIVSVDLMIFWRIGSPSP